MEQNLFAKEQHGFIPGHSCVTQLLEVFDSWHQALDDKKSVDVVYLDFSKAFDSVPHHRLLSKLDSYGIKGNILSWIRAFLTERKQEVAIGGETSSSQQVLSGIPQGSVLGPILFVIYINDLPQAVRSPCKLFADDAKVWATLLSDHDPQVLKTRPRESVTVVQNLASKF